MKLNERSCLCWGEVEKVVGSGVEVVEWTGVEERGGNYDVIYLGEKVHYQMKVTASSRSLGGHAVNVTPPDLGGSGMLNIRGRYFIDQQHKI
nr:hypothetical protein [Tanacetum cinerariifolium]